MLKVVIKDYFYSRDTSSAVVLSHLGFGYIICFDYMSITHDETHMKSFKWAKMLKFRGWITPPTNILG